MTARSVGDRPDELGPVYQPHPDSDGPPLSGVVVERDEAADPAEPDAESSPVDGGRWGGPVDTEPDHRRTLHATVIDRGAERPPLVPAWLRNPHERRKFVRESARFVAYMTALHVKLSPVYLAQAVWYAPWGFLRLAGRQIHWWWVIEQHGVRQHAATRNDAETWLKLHGHARQVRKGRGLALLAELVALVVVVALLVTVAPWWAQLVALVVAVPVLARFGRPVGRPILARVYSGPRFVRLHSEMVRAALCSLGVPGIREPSSITFPPPGIHRDGPGWLARVNLPAGVAAVKVLEKRDELSSALRLPVDQVWPAAGPDHAGQVDLWVGYEPASKMGQPRWSLLAETAVTSVFDPHEFGTDQRQRPVLTALFARNFLLGGVPGSGKSYGARTLASIAALDPTCELIIAEFKGTGDFADLEHLCSTYVCGIDDQALEAGANIIGWGLAEAERRAERVRRFKVAGLAPEGKVTPELAARPGSGLHPVVIIIDEAHELFLHDKAIAAAAERLIKRGRALGIIIVLATQIPDAKSVPPNITRCVTVRWCMAVQDQIANDMILGTGAYKRGLSAAVYRPGDDAGWGVAIGLARPPGPVRSYFPTPDQTRALVARATALRGGIVGGADEESRRRRDIVADVHEVFVRTGAKRLHREPLVAHLIEFWPESYTGWTADMLGDALRAAGVPVENVKVDGRNLAGVKREVVAGVVQARAVTAR